MSTISQKSISFPQMRGKAKSKGMKVVLNCVCREGQPARSSVLLRSLSRHGTNSSYCWNSFAGRSWFSRTENRLGAICGCDLFKNRRIQHDVLIIYLSLRYLVSVSMYMHFFVAFELQYRCPDALGTFLPTIGHVAPFSWLGMFHNGGGLL